MIRWVMLAALALAGCKKPDDRVCSSIAAWDITKSPNGWYEQRQVTTSCVEKWSRRLALGSDNMADISEAVLGACSDAIEYEQRAWAKEQNQEPDKAVEDRYWKRLSLFRIAQQRAGHCDIP